MEQNCTDIKGPTVINQPETLYTIVYLVYTGRSKDQQGGTNLVHFTCCNFFKEFET